MKTLIQCLIITFILLLTSSCKEKLCLTSFVIHNQTKHTLECTLIENYYGVVEYLKPNEKWTNYLFPGTYIVQSKRIPF